MKLPEISYSRPAFKTKPENAVLGAEEIRSANLASFPLADLDKQVERVRIARVHRENLNIDPFCIGQVPPLLKGDGLID